MVQASERINLSSCPRQGSTPRLLDDLEVPFTFGPEVLEMKSLEMRKRAVTFVTRSLSWTSLGMFEPLVMGCGLSAETLILSIKRRIRIINI